MSQTLVPPHPEVVSLAESSAAPLQDQFEDWVRANCPPELVPELLHRHRFVCRAAQVGAFAQATVVLRKFAEITERQHQSGAAFYAGRISAAKFMTRILENWTHRMYYRRGPLGAPESVEPDPAP